jgi:hypothetical protein
MLNPAAGSTALEIAYEQLVTYSERAGSGLAGSIVEGLTPGGGEWLDLQWTLRRSRHWLWRHRFDRLNLKYAAGDLLDVTLGRQTISWATTLFLTPADPFAPFDPADPFREYRAGVDALRLQAFTGTLTDIDLALRLSDTAAGTTVTALGRGRSVWKGWELSAWAGVLHDEPAAAVGAAGSVGQAALRGEASLREEDGDLAIRGTLGVDTRVTAFDRDLYLVFEYQHDDFGASGAEALVGVVQSGPFARGELQVLGRDEIAGQAAYRVHPLLDIGLMTLWNLNDGSALIIPNAAYSASNEVTLQAGAFLGFGDDTTDGPLGLPSEYGIVPAIAYVSVSAFF